MTGIELITQERLEQIEKHKTSPGLDAQVNSNGQLKMVAAYILTGDYDFYPDNWGEDFLNNVDSVKKTEIDRLVYAGALIAAEIDRLLYIQK